MDKNLEDLFNRMETRDTVKLSKTILAVDITDRDLREFIVRMYGSDDPILNRLATIFNAMVAQSRMVFLMSKRIASTLIEEDQNHGYKSLNLQTYKMMIAKLLTEFDIFVRLREPTRHQAGILELTDKTIRGMMSITKGEEYYKAQKVVSLKLFDNYELEVNSEFKDNKTTKPEPFSTEKYLKKLNADNLNNEVESE